MKRSATLALLFALLGATAVACGSDAGSNEATDPDGGGGGGSEAGPVGEGGPGTEAGPDGATITDGGSDADADVDGAIPDGPDVPPVAFPTDVPNLFGYDLVELYPGTFLSGAMDMAFPPGSNQPFVLQRGGAIVRMNGGGARDVNVIFDTEVYADAEAGALGIALHPRFDTGKPYAYVWYNAITNPISQRLSRFTWDAGTKKFGSEKVLIQQTEQVREHNGAHIRFGQDGFLYFGNGDDTRPDQTAQTLTGGLFSGIFRIDVDEDPAKSHAPTRTPTGVTVQTGYGIPNDNPFTGANVAEEYYAIGFRNPYSFNFDKSNGSLWLGDVGDTFREEVDQITKGGNYGWPVWEGTYKRRTTAITIGTYVPPKYEYLHSSMGDLTATQAGYIYRGAAMPELQGKLIFSDWPTGRVWALDTATGTRKPLVESKTSANYNGTYAPVGWGQDDSGELYLISWSHIYKLSPAAAHTVPKKLSDTKIFRNLSTFKTPTGVLPYAIKSPLWSDAASKDRFVYVPSGSKATMTSDGTVTMPPGSLLVKQFDLPASAAPTGGRTKRLETRVFVTGTTASYGVTYRWNAAGTDADLVVDPIDEGIADNDPNENRTWHFPSQGECWTCHRYENRVLGFRGEQLNFDVGGQNQLETLAASGFFDVGVSATSPAAIASPSDPNATLEARATAYLAANCSHCHHPGVSYLGGGETWNAKPGVPLANRGLVSAPQHNQPMAEFFGLPTAPLIKAGDANGSILWRRLSTTDADNRMPPVLRTRMDPLGVQVVQDWINGL